MTALEVLADLKDHVRWAVGRLRLIEADLNVNGHRPADAANARQLGEVIERLERKLS